MTNDHPFPESLNYMPHWISVLNTTGFTSRDLYLGGPSANSNWNIPIALKSLCGEIESAVTLIKNHEPHLAYRLAGNKETLLELGIASTCVILTGLIAEKALKTLIAQHRPQEKSYRTHHLVTLFRRGLDTKLQDEVEQQLLQLPRFWQEYAKTESASKILDIANTNFVDWRYSMEPPGATGGLPKPLLKVALTITLVGIRHLNVWCEL